jgi:hypothetical protein
MAEQSPIPKSSKNRNELVGFLLCLILIGTFLWRLFVPAHELPLRSGQVLDMGVDALLIVGLIGVRASLPKPLFVIALIAGLALFGIRLTSNYAWWSGHYSYSLQPR